MRLSQNLALVGLTLFLLYRGIIPALTTIDTDFPNYYTSSRLLIEGKEISRIYDDDWFQQQVYSYGINQQGKFSPFPPATALIMTPLAFLSPLNALRTWTVLNICFLMACVALLTNITGKSWQWNSLLFLSSGHALINNFRFGQFYLVLTLLVLSGYYYWTRSEMTKSGMLLGAAAAVKYFPVLFFPLFAFRREWKIVLTGFATFVAIGVLSSIFLGVNVHKQFFLTVFGDHIFGNIQNPFSSTFQSWSSLFRRLFVREPTLNAQPVVNSSWAYPIALTLVYVVILTFLWIGLKRSETNFGEHAHRVQFALLSLGGLLMLPASATYHFLLLILPVAILLSLKEQRWTTEQKALVFIFALIGFMPYSHFKHFESKGVLAILAYPRLILMLALFGTALSYVWKKPQPLQVR